MSETTITESIQKIADLAAAGLEPKWIGAEGEPRVPVIVAPPGYSIETFKNLLPAPLRIEQKTTHASLSSLADYLITHGTADTAIFADPGDNHFFVEAILDYHGAAKGKPSNAAPSWCAHRAVWTAQLSQQWLDWQAIAGKWIKQDDFAAFIDAHIDDIVSATLDVAGETITTPNQARMLTIARKAVAERNSTYKAGEFEANGDHQTHSRQITITRVGKGDDSFEVPEYFAIAVPVFMETCLQGQAEAAIAAPAQRVRLLVAFSDEGKLSFQIKLPAADRIRRDAFHAAIAALETRLDEAGAITGVMQIYYGTP